MKRKKQLILLKILRNVYNKRYNPGRNIAIL